MLGLLRVQNLAVIESATLEFSKGLNVITGETGAGKSILIGAVKLLLGERFSRGFLRDESKKLVVEGIFGGSFSDIPDDSVEQFQIEQELIIRREVDAGGKNRIFINGMLATLAQLKDVAGGLVDIHGQHEHQKLLNPACHIEFIDGYVPDSLKLKYRSLFDEYAEIDKKLSALKADRDKTMAEKDMLEFQAGEIEAMEIDLEEDLKLEDKLKVLGNLEKIRESLGGAINFLRDGEEFNASDLLSKGSSLVDMVADYSSELEKSSEELNDILYRLNDVCGVLESIIESQEADPEELDRLMDRKYKLGTLMKKYGPDLEEVVKKGQEIRAKLDALFMDESDIKKLENDHNIVFEKLKKEADVLNDMRMSVAAELSGKIEAVLEELELKNSTFNTDFKRSEKLDASGGITSEFMISTNPGFAPAPLVKAASGGEISRVMLALKEVFAKTDNIQTLIFDEIDTGISGITAKKVAEKLKNLGNEKQIIVITHLPVVAGQGTRHFHITKDVESEMAKTEISQLGNEEREKVIAMMISGELSESALGQARELLD